MSLRCYFDSSSLIISLKFRLDRRSLFTFPEFREIQSNTTQAQKVYSYFLKSPESQPNPLNVSLKFISGSKIVFLFS